LILRKEGKGEAGKGKENCRRKDFSVGEKAKKIKEKKRNAIESSFIGPQGKKESEKIKRKRGDASSLRRTAGSPGSSLKLRKSPAENLGGGRVQIEESAGHQREELYEIAEKVKKEKKVSSHIA